MTHARKMLDIIGRAAMAEMQDAYLSALTKQLRGESAEDEWVRFEKMLTRSLVLSNLCGRWGVCSSIRLVVPKEQGIKPTEVAEYADKPIITAPFERAINWFMGKVPSLRRTVDKLLPEAKAKAFWVTGVESTEALERIQARLTKPLTGEMPVAVQKPSGAMGSELPGSQEAFIKAEEAATGLARARLENVYRTNTLSAMNQGARDQMLDPVVKSSVALIQLNEIHDKRTRGAPGTDNPGKHWQMDGFIETPDNPIWAVITPPNGYQCRGSISPIGWASAERMGFAKDGKIDRDALGAHNKERWELIRSGKYPDPGFKS